MDKAATVEIVARFEQALTKEGIRVAKIVLFGSHAAGTAHEDSDIDLVVVSDDFEGKGLRQRMEILSEAIYELFEPIEAVGMTTNEWERGHSPLVEFAREGEVVYGG